MLERQALPLAICVAALAPEEQYRILAAAADDAADLYNADPALPPGERDLTAFTALDGKPIQDRDDAMNAIATAIALCFSYRPTRRAIPITSFAPLRSAVPPCSLC